MKSDNAFSRPMESGPYLAWGFGLAFIKYLSEAALIFAVNGEIFTPWAFVLPFVSLKSAVFTASPAWLPALILAWSLPFLFVGLVLTVQRCIDVNVSPWTAFWLLCPIINLPFMLALGCWPSAARPADRELEQLNADEVTHQSPLEALRAVFLGLLFGASALIIAVYALGDYGPALFMLTPILMAAITSHQFQKRAGGGLGKCLGLSMFCVTCAMLMLLLTALEGLVCVAMAAPMIYGGGAIGAVLGFLIAIAESSRTSMLPAIVLMPAMAIVERAFVQPALVEVTSSVEINASRETVWPRVIAFSPITEAPSGWLSFGIAYPMSARIEGSGVGAIRYCQFSTGDFVEPITIWDEPERLAFSVSSQPNPMTELSPYRHIHPPHLDGYLSSKRGEFRLVDLGGGRMRLEGHTWYTIDMYPQPYWQWWSNKLIHDIHLRVLRHIKSEVEQSKPDANS